MLSGRRMQKTFSHLLLIVLASGALAPASDDELYTHEATKLSFPKHVSDLVRDDPNTDGLPGSAGIMYRRGGTSVLLIAIMPVRPGQPSEPPNLVAAMLAMDRMRGMPATETGKGQ